ncbi:MAG: hypothetical protein WD509_01800 [Candidatus Paceibacterota bacterium]
MDAILRLVEKNLKKLPAEDTIVFTLEKAKTFDGILSDPEGVRLAIQKIQTDDNEMTAREETVERTVPYEGTAHMPDEIVKRTHYIVHVGDRGRFADYKKLKEKELDDTQRDVALVLEVASGKLYQKDNPGKKISMRKNSFPFKALECLLEDKGFVDAYRLSNIVKEGKTTTAHSKIYKLREQLAEAFGVSKDTFIESRRDGNGYKVKNIKLNKKGIAV